MATKSGRKPSKQVKCLHCSNKAITRGVCLRCRAQIRGMIDRGEHTDESAVEAGLMHEAKSAGRPPTGGILAKLKR